MSMIASNHIIPVALGGVVVGGASVSVVSNRNICCYFTENFDKTNNSLFPQT